jgi:hypothetical protein
MEKIQVQTQPVPAEQVPTEKEPKKQDPSKKEEIQARLAKLGFKAAVSQIDRIDRMKIAYEQFMFVTPEHIQNFNAKLRAETLQEDKRTRRFKTLVFTDIEKYGAIPPEETLAKIEKAQGMNIFDRFEIAKIDWKEEIIDPIVFGRINECEDYFFVAQWDDDVHIEDLILGK